MADVKDRIVSGVLNFTADREDGGRFCNTDSSKSFQTLEACEVQITDARLLDEPPSIACEGFALVEHHVDSPDWENQEWRDTEYAQSCLDLVKRVTGASKVVPFFVPLLRKSDPATRGDSMSHAGFVHIDHPRETARTVSEFMAAEAGETFKRATLYNVWKAITAPPQDFPLTVADRRTIPPRSHVIGQTVSDFGDTPYVILANDPDTKFYYFSDMTLDESIVFTGIDFDPASPLGCAHSAFLHPNPEMHGVPRSSIEARIIAIFE